jgi:hypothetical protein
MFTFPSAVLALRTWLIGTALPDTGIDVAPEDAEAASATETAASTEMESLCTFLPIRSISRSTVRAGLPKRNRGEPRSWRED